jgi:segregation and condensation protein A
MEEMNLVLAGEFFLMAATLLEIKTRMMLPKPPADSDGEDDEGVDPRLELIERLREYERYKAQVEVFLAMEDERRRMFFRTAMDSDPRYEIPPVFGEGSSNALIAALRKLLAEVDTGEQAVTSVRRQKMSLQIAMRTLLHRVRESGEAWFDELFERPLVRMNIVMTFLGLLELLRQGLLHALQDEPLGPIRIVSVDLEGGAAS